MPNLSAFQPIPDVRIKHPEWCKKSTIYQLNTRQFTPEGTLVAAEAQLPRLRDLGVDLIWLMPINVIGEKNRKGSLGSPYSVKDYYAVNPEFGTLNDLKHFVQTAHDLGLRVILDWVANHTAWDNPLTTQHPEWYARDWKGDFMPTPWWDWDDIIELDYSLPEVRQYMTEAMAYWVREADIDGYRCDVAGYVPTDFWNTVRRELDAIKPVFMLAEWENRDLHAEAFDMTYAWSWHDAVGQVTGGGRQDLSGLFVYYSWNEKAFPADGIRMNFTTNHDKNAWEGTEYEVFGDGLEPATVLSFVSEGMALIYNGQEAGNTRRLAFFERDPIDWRPHPLNAFYQKLIALKRANSALWNGAWGARMVRVFNTVPNHVFSFVRRNAENKVFAVFNFSSVEQSVSFKDALCHGAYVDAFGGGEAAIDASTTLTLQPWGYRVYTQAGVSSTQSA
jgi:glycosidase